MFIDCLALERAPLREERVIEDGSSGEESMGAVESFEEILVIALKLANGTFSLMILRGRFFLPSVVSRARGSF